MDASKYYEAVEYNLGVVKHGETPLFEFRCTDNKLFVRKGDNIPMALVGCGCTTAHMKKNGDVYGYIDVNGAVGRDHNTGFLRKGNFMRSINVYINDGVDFFIKNKKNRSVRNPDKKFVTLKVSGTVK